MKAVGMATAGFGIRVPGVLVLLVLGFTAYGIYNFVKRPTA